MSTYADSLRAICCTLNPEKPNISLFSDAYELAHYMQSQNDKTRLPYTERMRDYALEVISECDDAYEMAEWYEIYKKLLLLDAYDVFDCYMLYVEWNRDPKKKFYLPRRKVLKTVVDDLQDLADGKIKFLGLSMPPRTGKSTLCIFFMTWILGRNPETANVMSGHSDKLTKGFYGEILSIIANPEEYLWNDVFPGLQIIKKSAEDEAIDLGYGGRPKRFVSITCRSIGGTLTGAVEVGEEGILYVDDAIEDREEALNAVRVEAKYQAYLNQLVDRKKDGARELMVMTRWCVADPLGRVRDQYEGNPEYRFRVVPALDENDESNFDYDYGVGFSTEYYRNLRDRLDDADWRAKYMGDPYEREGLLYPKEELRRFFELPDEEPDGIIAVCDTKDRGQDFESLPVAYIYGNQFYIADAVFDDSVPEVVETKVVETLLKHNVQKARFESNSAGGRIADSVQQRIKDRNGRTKIETKYSTANKETRMILSSSWVKENCLFYDESKYPSTDYKRFMQQLTSYTLKGRNAHDDAPDSISMLENYAMDVLTPVVEAFKRPF